VVVGVVGVVVGVVGVIVGVIGVVGVMVGVVGVVVGLVGVIGVILGGVGFVVGSVEVGDGGELGFTMGVGIAEPGVVGLKTGIVSCCVMDTEDEKSIWFS
jgi:hypothetical protein